MNVTDHAFTNTDAEYAQIKALLFEIENRPEIDNNWEPGRMDWWRYNYHVEKEVAFFEANAHYWKTDADQVVALFISEYGGDDFFIVIHPDFWSLFDDVLNWGLTVWAKDKSKITTDVYTFGEQKIAQLMAAGFYKDTHVENVRMYQMDGYDFAYQLKPSFAMMSFAEYGNYESKVELVRNSFGNPNFTETRLRSTQESPNYRPNLDLVVVNATGESVAYCMGWIEENNPKVGFIEPMGTHSEYRQNGFGKALAKECFKRLHALGVETAWIASNAEPHVSNYLYDALKPVSVKRSFRYAFDIGG